MDFHILFVFKVGHSVQRKAKPLMGRTHHWRCYVDSWNPRYALSSFVKKVTFKLHDTFENPKQVVRQAPFAIEEDGFGTFQLQIEVSFLNCMTTFLYDLTLFDYNVLHTYRTVRMSPSASEWEKLIRLGGIVIPASSDQSQIYEIVQTIQSCQNLEALDVYSFYPHLKPKYELGQSDTSKLERSLSGDTEQEVNKSQGQPDIDLGQLDLSSSFLLTHQPLPQKHKKKLELMHEAQLLLEKAQQEQKQNWVSPTQPVIATSSSDCRTESSPSWPQVGLSSENPNPIESPLSCQSSRLTSCQSDSLIRVGDSEIVDPPKERIILKLSRIGLGNQLTVSTSHPFEKKRRKKDQTGFYHKSSKKAQHQKVSTKSKNYGNLNIEAVELSPHKLSHVDTKLGDTLSKDWIQEHNENNNKNTTDDYNRCVNSANSCLSESDEHQFLFASNASNSLLNDANYFDNKQDEMGQVDAGELRRVTVKTSASGSGGVMTTDHWQTSSTNLPNSELYEEDFDDFTPPHMSTSTNTDKLRVKEGEQKLIHEKANKNSTYWTHLGDDNQRLDEDDKITESSVIHNPTKIVIRTSGDTSLTNSITSSLGIGGNVSQSTNCMNEKSLLLDLDSCQTTLRHGFSEKVLDTIVAKTTKIKSDCVNEKVLTTHLDDSTDANDSADLSSLSSSLSESPATSSSTSSSVVTSPMSSVENSEWTTLEDGSRSMRDPVLPIVSGNDIEFLYDRLLRLREPKLAIRMSEILLEYDESSRIVKDDHKMGVTLVYDEPKLIEFDLRKLPQSCLDKLTGLISEDEELERNVSVC